MKRTILTTVVACGLLAGCTTVRPLVVVDPRKPPVTSVERGILQLLLDGHIDKTAARRYLANTDDWHVNYKKLPEGKWVGVSDGKIFTGDTYDEVSEQIYTADSGARPFIGYVPESGGP